MFQKLVYAAEAFNRLLAIMAQYMSSSPSKLRGYIQSWIINAKGYTVGNMKRLLFVISFLLTALFYHPILNLSFTQDDWFLLRQAKFNSPPQQVFSSLPNLDSIFFRPLGMQGYFYFTYRALGLHESMYRLVTIAVHSLNVVLIFSLSSLVFSSVISSLSISILYLLSPLHFASLGWLANVSFVSGACFTLLALKAGIQGKRTFAIGFFAIGLLVNELVISVPLLLFLLLTKERVHRKESRTLFVMMIISASYMLFRLVSLRATSGSYEMTFDPRLIAQNIRWLFLWSLGWPETVRDHFLSLFSMRREFVQTFSLETAIFVFTTLTSVGLMVTAVLRKPFLIIGFVWFLVAISPVVFFRSHVFPHYAMIGSIGLYFLIISGFRHHKPVFKILFVMLWLIQSLLAFRVNLATHWWIQHAALSASLVEQARKYQILSTGQTITLRVSDPEQARVVLAGDSAMQVLYNDPAVKTVFVTDEARHPGT